jgi:hypothetical protein
VKTLIHDRHIRIIDTETGQLLRELILDPTKDYQPQKPQNGVSGRNVCTDRRRMLDLAPM